MYRGEALLPSEERPVRRPVATPYVVSEVGSLRTVLVHRPGPELRAVENGDPRRQLFAEPVSAAAAAAEHDAFVATLRREGADVLYLEDLLAEARSPLSPRTAGLPNLLYTRDPGACIGPGVVAGAMATRIRRPEARIFRSLYRRHPLFASAPQWLHGGGHPVQFEGGDVLVASPRRIVVGVGERTSAVGAERLAQSLIDRGAVAEVATLRVPRGAGFHLDLVMTMVDHDAVAIRSGLRERLAAHLWTARRRGAVKATPLADPLDVFPHGVRAIELDEPRSADDPRGWDRGANVLAVAPGRVIAYADNVRSNDRLAASGIEVVAVDGTALAKGRGGPRCLTFPLLRDEDGGPWQWPSRVRAVA